MIVKFDKPPMKRFGGGMKNFLLLILPILLFVGCGDPIESKLQGEWVGKNQKDTGSFVFRSDGTALIIDDKEQDIGYAKWKVDSSKEPCQLDFTGDDYNAFGIIKFLSPDKFIYHMRRSEEDRPNYFSKEFEVIESRSWYQMVFSRKN